MTGTLAGALEARGIPAAPNRLESEVEGVIERVDGTIAITNIRIRYRLKIPKGKREEAERALSVHKAGCPASASVERGIVVEWAVDIEETEEAPPK